jgi:predicted Fe-Mo cluster-binding NifX family protein
MKTAFSFWQGRIAPVFDVSRQVYILETADGVVGSRTEASLPDEGAPGRAARLADLGVKTLVCGAISRYLQGALEAVGITVIPFVSGSLGEVIDAWGNGRIADASFAMPGCCDNMRGRRRGVARFAEDGNTEGCEGFGHQPFGRGGFGIGRRGGQGNCVCPRCGFIEAHEPGTPCVSVLCPRCRTSMARQ